MNMSDTNDYNTICRKTMSNEEDDVDNLYLTLIYRFLFCVPLKLILNRFYTCFFNDIPSHI